MIVLFLVFNLLLFCASYLSVSPLFEDSAFCRKSESGLLSYNHPLPAPESHIPWVWDAIYDPFESYVDLVIITPTACTFNQSIWHEASRRFPMHHSYLGHGLQSNVLVNPDCEKTRKINSMSVIGKVFMCIFYNGNTVVHRGESRKVLMRFPVLGNIVVRCPVPSGLQFDSLQLESHLKSAPFCSSYENDPPFNISVTKIFPVCTVPHYDKHHKQYNLSIVSATSRADASKMVEWIEYHLVLGVQHFFLYNTATDSETQTRLIQILDPYVRDDTVTLIPWYFMNCVRGMGSGRALHFFNTNHKFNVSDPSSWYNESSYDFHSFRPPKRIANYAALNSAYTRFRHTSTYILYVDDDEFVSFAVGSATHNIREMANTIFERHPNHSAILFHPIEMNDCPDSDKLLGRNRSYFLPRIGNMNYAFVTLGHSHEFKPLMRTDDVVFFSVHYISLIEQTYVDESVSSQDFHFPIGKGAILHYKTPAHISQDPFSYMDFLPIRNTTQAINCQQSNLFGGYHNGMYIEQGHVLPAGLMNQLILNIADRRKPLY